MNPDNSGRFISVEAQIDEITHAVLVRLPRSGIGGAGHTCASTVCAEAGREYLIGHRVEQAPT